MTSEGKFDSKVSKKRTAKDECKSDNCLLLKYSVSCNFPKNFSKEIAVIIKQAIISSLSSSLIYASTCIGTYLRMLFVDDSSRPPLYQAPTRRDSMGEVSNVSTTVSRKKKSAALIEPKRQAASGKVRLNVELNSQLYY